MMEFNNYHTKIERFLHNLAFKPWYPRIALSRIEMAVYKSHLKPISVEKPVFITALPRAGTTLLLKLSVETKEFASHTYREMPFLFTPLLWDSLSKNLRNTGASHERVHGDRIQVNLESPESFEEIIWKEFWPSHYKSDRIIPWKSTSFPEFEDFLIDHMRKIILLKGLVEKQVRYISKNNLNIARIEYLSKNFPDSRIIVLFRSPLQQAASLLKQHQNFLRIHKVDPFARKYMEDTGHYDFGENLRPVDFEGWYREGNSLETNTLSFWLQYWIEAYQYQLQKKNDQVRFFSFDSLCEDPKSSLARLGAILDLVNIDRLMKNNERIKSPKPHDFNTDGIPLKVLNEAKDLFIELEKAEIN